MAAMLFEMKFVWLGRLALSVLVLMLGCDLALLSNFPMHLYAMYLGICLVLVVPFFFSRLISAWKKGKSPGPHLYRLYFFTVLGFGLTLVWSLKFAPLENAFRGLDLGLLGDKALAMFFSYFTIKATLFALGVMCLSDAFWRGHLRRLRIKAERDEEAAQRQEQDQLQAEEESVEQSA
jgi:hypothetical protein